MSSSRRLLAEYPTGELFRNRYNRPWKSEAVNCCFDRIQSRMGKAILKEGGKDPSEKQIAKFINTLASTKREKGVVLDTRPDELRQEAKEKLFKRMASKVAPRYSLHALRHSWATNALKRGIDPLTVALLMAQGSTAAGSCLPAHVAQPGTHARPSAPRNKNLITKRPARIPAQSPTGQGSMRVDT